MNINIMEAMLICFNYMHEHLSGKLIHEHLWDRRTEPLSVRRGAEVARRADRGEAHEQFYPASELSGEIILLLLLVWLY